MKQDHGPVPTKLGSGCAARCIPPQAPPASIPHSNRDVISYSGPPPVAFGPDLVALASSLATSAVKGESRIPLQITIGNARSTTRKHSTGWTSSLLVHSLVLLFLWMLLAPADMGGMGVRVLTLTLEDDAEVTQFASFTIPSDITTTLPAFESHDADQSPSLDLIPVPQFGGGNGAEKADVKRVPQQGPDAPSGSFFGIKSSGQNFVYVLDVSGSMRNGRYERAAAELFRSVDQLSEQQNFYVLLFNSTTTQLFNNDGILPLPVACTEANKERLAQWLETSSPRGGTDPRDALRIALKMRPSAIFMLSDGKFDSVSKRSSSGLTSTDTSAFTIVAADRTSTPIHSVALENPNSSENMQRLSNISKGEYRFAERRTDENTQGTLERAQVALKNGNTGIARVLLSDIAVAFPKSENGLEAKRWLAKLRFQRALNELRNNQVALAKLNITKLVGSCPSAILTSRFRHEFFPAFVDAVDSTADAKANQSQSLAEKNEQVQTTPNDAPVVDRSNVVIDSTKPSQANANTTLPRNPPAGIHPNTNTTNQLNLQPLECDVQSQLLKADVKTIRYLRQVADVFAGNPIATTATEFLNSVAKTKIIELRDALHSGDENAAERINQQLSDGFEDHPTLPTVRSRLFKNERKAKILARIAKRLESAGKLVDARLGYTKILENYPLTLETPNARKRVQAIDQQFESTSQTGDEMSVENPILPDQNTETDSSQEPGRKAIRP